MTRSNIVHLAPSDMVEKMIDRTSREIANYFKDPKKKVVIGDFCELLKRSGKWNQGEIEEKFRETKEQLVAAYEKADINIYQLISSLEKAFKYASKNTRGYLGSLRGRLFEGLLVGLYGGTYILENPPSNEKRGWGVKVSIPTTQEKDVISFEHPSGDSNKSRKTMDYAYLKEEKRLFYECKIQPERFGESEQKYFELFSEKFNEFDIEYYLCFFAADLCTEVEMELADEEFSFELQYLGYDNAQDFIDSHK